MKLLTIIFILFSFSGYGQARGKWKLPKITTPANQRPVALAGVDQAIQLPTSTATLTGSGIDYDGTITAYLWTKFSGPATGTITSQTSASTGLTSLGLGSHIFKLRVTDNAGDTAVDYVTIVVNSAINNPPVANAGIDKTRTLPSDTATLFGSGTDADGTIVSYAWVKVVGSPSGGVITSSDSATTTITGLVWGVYKYQLTVTDNSGGVAIDTMLLTVNPYVTPPTANGAYSFIITDSSRVSIGVFKNDSVLVTTLESNIIYAPGTYTKYWDGKDDYGNTITSPDTSYKIRVLINRVQYTWQGTIGNNSDSMTGLNKHKSLYHCMRGLVFVGSYGYFCSGYSEGAASIAKFHIATPRQRISSPLDETHADNNYVATDGVNLYWAAFDPFQNNNTFVYGTKVSDDLETQFSTGIPYSLTYGRTYPKTISKVNQMNSFISGLAVQSAGTYLFVARKGLNQLQVLNKTTGALVQTLTYTNARNLCVDAGGNLWMVTGTNTVAKYTVNVNGTLTSATLTLSGLVDPLALQVSNDGTLISVADGSTSQQVKFFNNSTGAATNTLGVAGGYATDATVNNNKFYFADARTIPASPNLLPFIAYQSDGSFWVGDPGNLRVQHYNSSRTYIDRIMSLGSTYSVSVDKNNINRVFVGFMEFAIDYSVQTLTGSTGWSLVKNWGANITDAYDGMSALKFSTTLSNGRTYAFVRPNPNWEIAELMPGGTLRLSGILRTGLTSLLCSDGSLQDYENSATTATYKRYPLSGFDGSNNPIWSSTAEVLGSGSHGQGYSTPAEQPAIQMFDETNKIVLYNANGKYGISAPALGYHLGIMARGAATDAYLAQTERSTHLKYEGEFPAAGWFDVGNEVNNYAGANVNIIGRNIITAYHGEFWKAAQTNKFNHYYDNGLALGQFGITNVEAGIGLGKSNSAVAMAAGNVLTPMAVKDASGDLYIWHGDESVHAGVHRWKITGLNTIAEQVITIPFPSAYVAPTLTYTNLMSGLPFDATLVNSTAGWTRNPVSDNTILKANTSRHTYDPKVRDLSIEFSTSAAGTYNVSRDLGTNNVTNDWTLSGELLYKFNTPNSTPLHQYFEVLDNTGKVLTTFYPAMSGTHPTYTSVIKANAVDMFSVTEVGTGTLSTLMGKYQPFSVSIAAGVVTFQYAGLTPVVTTISDATGDWRRPTTLRLRFLHDGGFATAYGNNIDVKDLKFYKDSPAP